jgi:hypothetical protein
VSTGFLASAFAFLFITLSYAEGLSLVQRVLSASSGVVFLAWTLWLTFEALT